MFEDSAEALQDPPARARTQGVNPHRSKVDPYESAYWRALLLVLLIVPFVPVLWFGIYRQASKDSVEHATGRGIVRGAFHGLGLALLLYLGVAVFVSAATRPAVQRQIQSEEKAESQRNALRYGDPETPNTAVEDKEAQQLADYHEQRQARIAKAEYARTHEKGIEHDAAYEAQRAKLKLDQAPPAIDPPPAAVPEFEAPTAPTAPRARTPTRRDPKTVGVADPAPAGDAGQAQQLVEALNRPASAPAKPSYAITLKDGRTIDAVQLVDAGDVYSVKTAAGKFVTLKKSDVAGVPAELLPKR